MQTDQIQNKILYNTGAPPKSAPLPDTDADFKQALSRQMERKADQPAPPAPESAPTPPPRSQTQKQPPKQVQAAQPKPAQQSQPTRQASKTDQANQASQAADSDTAAAQDACAAPETAATTPAAAPADAAAAATGDAAAAEAAAAAAAADPMASMLAMVAAYQQLTTAKADTADTGTAATATDSAATDAAALAALQGDATGKRAAAAADLAAEGGKHGTGTSGLQQAHAEDADAALLTKLAPGAERTAATTDAKAEKFAAKLAEATTAPQPVLPQSAQALAATTAQAANAVAANQLQARVGSNAWEQQLGQKVVWMVAGGDQSASLTLNPPDLGPLQVVLNVSNDQATATFTAHQPETRQAIENALPKLREMMNEAGIQLGDASVSAGTQEQQQAFAEQARGSGGGGSRYGDAGAAADDAPAQPVLRRSVLGAVDTFA